MELTAYGPSTSPRGSILRGGGAGDAAAGRASALPCLGHNNCITTKPQATEQEAPSHVRKGEFALRKEVQDLAKRHGIERVGFLTLTFREDIQDRKEASRRFHSFLTNVLKKRYPAGIRVMERQASGRIHFHCVVSLRDDIRTGFDFAQATDVFLDKRTRYSSASSALKAEWSFLRGACEKYGFGRHELMPVKSNAEGIAKYVGKYLGKHWTARRADDKGARLVSYWGCTGQAAARSRVASCQFQWANGKARVWRSQMEEIDKVACYVVPHYLQRGKTGADRFKFYFGPNWSWKIMKTGAQKGALHVRFMEELEINHAIASAKYYGARRWLDSRPSHSCRTFKEAVDAELVKLEPWLEPSKIEDTPPRREVLVYAQRTVSNPSGVTVRALANGQSGLKTKSACNSITEEDARLAAEAMGRRFHHAAP